MPLGQPEQIIWNDNVCKQCLEYSGVIEIEETLQLISNEQNFKNKFALLSEKTEKCVSELEFNFIKRWINTEAETISQIKVNILDKII